MSETTHKSFDALISRLGEIRASLVKLDSKFLMVRLDRSFELFRETFADGILLRGKILNPSRAHKPLASDREAVTAAGPKPCQKPAGVDVELITNALETEKASLPDCLDSNQLRASPNLSRSVRLEHRWFERYALIASSRTAHRRRRSGAREPRRTKSSHSEATIGCVTGSGPLLVMVVTVI